MDMAAMDIAWDMGMGMGMAMDIAWDMGMGMSCHGHCRTYQKFACQFKKSTE